MSPRRFLAHLAEHALSHGRPLGPELESVVIPSRRWKERALQAAAHAEAGDLALALSSLRLSPLVHSVALFKPEAAQDLSRALRKLPNLLFLLPPILVPVVYLSLVVFVELVAATVLRWKVLPVLQTYSANLSAPLPSARLLPSAGTIVFVPLFAAGLFVAVWRRRRARMGVGVLSGLRLGRLFAAAAVLERHGMAPAESLPRLAAVAGVPAHRLDDLAAPGALDGAACEESARHLAANARRDALRFEAAVKLLGGMVTALIAFLIASSVYLSILRLNNAFGPP